MYDCEEYAASRLLDTLVRFRGKAVKVLCVFHDMTCDIYHMSGGWRAKVHLDDLDLRSPPLGFVNKGSGCMYIARKPMRHDWRQGVRPNSVIDVRQNYRPSFESIAKCIDGEFPTITKAFSMLSGDYKEVALSREFSITRNRGKHMINYKWYGKVAVLEEGVPKLSSKYKYLQKEVEKLL
tara:strand:+ start:5938 stop:6477 length:540 start_codon:yes stop_codon:yes gene_type:complete